MRVPPSPPTKPDCVDSAPREHPFRSRARRYPFVAGALLTDLESERYFQQHTCDLSLFGCQITFENGFPPGAKVRIRIVHKGATFHALARIARCDQAYGLGIVFTNMEETDRRVLENWVCELRSQRQ